MSIGDDEGFRTKSVSARRVPNTGGSSGSSPFGLTCPFCGEVMDNLFPGQNGPAFYGCPRGCNQPSGGGVTRRTVQDIQRELNQNRRNWKERASLKER